MAHGDHKSPKDGVVPIPLPNGLTGFFLGVNNYLLSGMILQMGQGSSLLIGLVKEAKTSIKVFGGWRVVHRRNMAK